MTLAFPKPEPIKRVKRRRKREEAAVVIDVRGRVERRDGYCRFKLDRPNSHECSGPSEWAHLSGHRRSNTRGMDPVLRHTLEFTMMLCQRAHRWEESGRLQIAFADRVTGAEGMVLYTLDDWR